MINTVDIKLSIERMKEKNLDTIGSAFNRGLDAAIKIIELYENIYFGGIELQYKKESDK